MDPVPFAVPLLESWGYPLLFVLLLVTGIGSPVPEDMLLLVAGYLSYAGTFTVAPVLFVSWCGVVVSDVVLYAAGRHLAWHSHRWPEGHFLSPERLLRATRWFERAGNVLILVARLVPGTRAVVFVTAGLRGVPLGQFLAYDGLGAALWVPLTVAVGRSLGPSLGEAPDLVERIGHGTTWVVAAASVLFLLWLKFGREQSKL